MTRWSRSSNAPGRQQPCLEPAVGRRDADDPFLRDEEVRVTTGPVTLAGHLTIPQRPTGIVVFAHGSGGSRHSPRNRYVAEGAQPGRLGHLAVRPSHPSGRT